MWFTLDDILLAQHFQITHCFLNHIRQTFIVFGFWVLECKCKRDLAKCNLQIDILQWAAALDIFLCCIHSMWDVSQHRESVIATSWTRGTFGGPPTLIFCLFVSMNKVPSSLEAFASLCISVSVGRQRTQRCLLNLLIGSRKKMNTLRSCFTFLFT